MAALIRKNVRLLGYGKFIAFFIGCIVFSIAGRIGEALTFEQHMVSAVSDHYYLIYFVIPILLFFYLFFIKDDSKIVLVRYKSYFSYFCKKWFACGVIPLLMSTGKGSGSKGAAPADPSFAATAVSGAGAWWGSSTSTAQATTTPTIVSNRRWIE